MIHMYSIIRITMKANSFLVINFGIWAYLYRGPLFILNQYFMCLHFIVLRWHSSAYLGHLQIISAGFICTIKIEEWVHSCATSQHYQSYQRWFWRGDIYRILKLKFVAKRKNSFVCLCLCFFLFFWRKVRIH